MSVSGSQVITTVSKALGTSKTLASPAVAYTFVP